MLKPIFISITMAVSVLLIGGAHAQSPMNTQYMDSQYGAYTAQELFENGRDAHNRHDYQQAKQHYYKAAKNGSTDALVNLGYLYFMGEGVSQDYAIARAFYNRATKNGDQDAKHNLEMMDRLSLALPPKPVFKTKPVAADAIANTSAQKTKAQRIEARKIKAEKRAAQKRKADKRKAERLKAREAKIAKRKAERAKAKNRKAQKNE